MAEHVPGVHLAAVLFDKGLWFDAVVRGLVRDLGLGIDEAREAAIAATARRLRGERALRATSAHLRESDLGAVDQMA